MKENVLILIVVALQFFIYYYRCIVTKRSIN